MCMLISSSATCGVNMVLTGHVVGSGLIEADIGSEHTNTKDVLSV